MLSDMRCALCHTFKSLKFCMPPPLAYSLKLRAYSPSLPRHLARKLRQCLISPRRHQDRLADLDAPAVHPHAENRMQHVAGLEHIAVALAQADRVLAPIRRIADADR